MTEIEKIERYIARTRINNDDRYCLRSKQAVRMAEQAMECGGLPYEVIVLAFEYGRAKGYRAAKAEVRK